MRNLFVSNLCLWPRFHADVSSCLRECTPAVVELHLEMTQPMMSIQSASLDLINFTLQELKRINPTLEAYEELNMVSAVGRSFQKQLQTELDPIWHQLSWKTKQLVSDLRTLRTVLLYLTQYDCVTFLAFVSGAKLIENVFIDHILI
jgi:DNA excision repair protein ERCC-4